MNRPLQAKLGALRDGEVIELEGVQLKMTEGKSSGHDLSPGDTYYACRNTEQLLTVQKVDLENGWVAPVEMAYLFNLRECVGVEMIEA